MDGLGTSWRNGLPSAILLALVCLLPGCGKAGPETYSVTGTVTWRGKPVPTGNVMFVPDNGPPAVGLIAADGTYRLRAVAGKHRVGVTAIPKIPSGVELTTYMAKPLVPARFNRPDESGIVVEVQPGDDNSLDLDLK